MDHGRTGVGRCGRVGGHGPAPYLRPVPLAAVLAFLLVGARADAAPPTLAADGKPRRFEVRVAGGASTFHVTTVAGCHYRLTIDGGTLRRPLLEIARPDEEPFASADAGSAQARLVHAWFAERDALLEARVRGFSAMTGDGQIRFEVLGPDGQPIPTHRRFLAPTPGEEARAGELLVGDANTWELLVEEGRAYEIAPTSGSAGRVRLLVLDWAGEALADSQHSAVSWLARPPLRFRVPPRPPTPAQPPAKGRPDDRPDSILLEVRGLFDGGGTYGLRLRELREDEDVEALDVTPPEPVQRGLVDGEPLAFVAGPGDLAMVFVPHAPMINQLVQVLRGERWVTLEDIGRGTSARSPEDALTAWFQPWYPGTYRFVSVPMDPPTTPRLFLMDRAALGGAPIHMGTGSDPTPRARLGSKWRLLALGVVMPGKDYLFVCVHGPDHGVAMRVLDPQGRVLRTRPAGGDTISPGLGPSLRFQVREPGIYRLEARSARPLIVRPLLRRASN